jgi:uncharacterized protein YjaZ
MNCEFCKKTFNSISSLNKHKNTTKYCLEIQGKEKKKTNIFLCEYCDKTFSGNNSLQKHLSNCKVKELQEENKTLSHTIKEYVINIKNMLQIKKATSIKKEISIFIVKRNKITSNCKNLPLILYNHK